VWQIADIELQHTFAFGEQQKMVWGVAAHLNHDELNDITALKDNPAMAIAFTPASRTQYLYSAFVQDNVTLLPETLHLIFGSRIEHNESTGWEFQPTVRLAWTPFEEHTFWSAVSRAVRTPSRAETTILEQISSTDPTATPPRYYSTRLVGNPDIPSEKMIAYEAGYRYQPLKTLSFDMALFYNDYSSLIGVEVGKFSTYLPINVVSNGAATGKGGELSVDWRPLTWINLAMAYSYIDLSVLTTSSTLDSFSKALMNAATAPRHLASVRSVFDLSKNVKCTLWLRYVDSLNMTQPSVDDYFTMDARVAWKPIPALELSLDGKNLLESKHLEYGDDSTGFQFAPIPRSVYGKVAWSF
jgi:iron complex outermembrane receptor protein